MFTVLHRIFTFRPPNKTTFQLPKVFFTRKFHCTLDISAPPTETLAHLVSAGTEAQSDSFPGRQRGSCRLRLPACCCRQPWGHSQAHCEERNFKYFMVQNSSKLILMFCIPEIKHGSKQHSTVYCSTAMHFLWQI